MAFAQIAGESGEHHYLNQNVKPWNVEQARHIERYRTPVEREYVGVFHHRLAFLAEVEAELFGDVARCLSH